MSNIFKLAVRLRTRKVSKNRDLSDFSQIMVLIFLRAKFFDEFLNRFFYGFFYGYGFLYKSFDNFLTNALMNSLTKFLMKFLTTIHTRNDLLL